MNVGFLNKMHHTGSSVDLTCLLFVNSVHKVNVLKRCSCQAKNTEEREEEKLPGTFSLASKPVSVQPASVQTTEEGHEI